MLSASRTLLISRPLLLVHARRPLLAAAVPRLPQLRTIKNTSATMTPKQPIEVLIKNDHKSFEELYSRYKSCSNQQDQQAIVNELIREVAQHSIAEETVVYPAMEKHNILGEGEKLADHLRQDHYAVKQNLYELDQTPVTSPKFAPLLEKVMKLLISHAKEEETKELPALAKAIDTQGRISMSKQFMMGKVIAPTRPHPDAPDKPAILELLAGMPVAPIDKMRDAATKTFAERRIPIE
ncbi:hemerythrin HHE cation binding domain protein [Phlyctochytrium arcticum]|nr:hemerythrin HHE cation binding domain protein [Phlyctochytrium arcticum]KAI9097205.1 hemerythrin HHE cation binding domain protein [Phlyctochytrium arcticum]